MIRMHHNYEVSPKAARVCDTQAGANNTGGFHVHALPDAARAPRAAQVWGALLTLAPVNPAQDSTTSSR